MIKQLDRSEYSDAIALSLRVFIECDGANGLETFKSFIYNEELMNELTIYGVFENKRLIGVMGTKNDSTHISIFFIDLEFQRKGIGKKLFEFAFMDQPSKQITVNSSSYAVRFYENIGFTKTTEEQNANGLRYTPMVRAVNHLY